MDPANYYLTTLLTAIKTLTPIAGFIIGGYLIFIKLPFLFLRKSMDDQKRKLQDDAQGPRPSESEKYGIEDYRAFQNRLRLMNGGKEQNFKTEGAKDQRSEKKENQKKNTGSKRTNNQQSFKKSTSSSVQTPEEVFNFRSGEKFSKADLKKRYFELLKQNHPDRVASLGQEFRELAEKNTKNINKAYEFLKTKAS